MEGTILDSERFDRLVQSFGQTRSRRQTLRGLAGLAAVGALALGGQEADASKRIGGSPCTKGRQCKTGKCVGTSGAKTCSCSNKFPRCAASDTFCQSGTCETCAPNDTHNCVAGAPGAVECCSGICCNTGGDPADSYCCTL
jgi:hypothetical protein